MNARKSISGKTRNMVAERQGWRCVYKRLGDKEPCGKELKVIGFDVDHIQAVVHDGPSDAANYRAICIPCHKLKTKLDIQANAKIKRITGVTKGPAKKAWGKGRKLESRPFRRKQP